MTLLGVHLSIAAILISTQALPAPNVQRHASGHRYLADPIESLKPHYKYLIVGSGYGASVTAFEIAQALHMTGKGAAEAVAILERGRELLPGDFPKNIVELGGAVRSGLNPLGLISTNTHLDADMDVVGVSGVGGTSLYNAAIKERPPANVWSLPRWPAEIRKDFESGELETYFRKAEFMLMPGLGPNTRSLLKSKAHLENFPPSFPTGELNLNVNHEEGRERFGVIQHACTCCGNCCGGCNVGAKNTLTTNYLPAAKDFGTEIFSQIEVNYIEKLRPDAPGSPRYRVHYTYWLGSMRSKSGSVTADNVFLGAGSAGSTQILMRSQSDNFKMSPRLGTGVSANGDVLGFVYNSKVRTNIAAHADTATLRAQPNPVGQTITVYGDYRLFNANEPIERQFILLDGAIPRAAAPTVAHALGVAMLPQAAVTSLSGASRIAKDLASPLSPPEDGALNHSMLLLACGHDSCGGRYVLDSEGKAYVVWPNMQEEESFKYINTQMEAYAERMGGKFIKNPRSTLLGGGKMQATHPLGGAPMGSSVENGVVNHLGQVFDVDGGVHEGLFVVDAAIIPHSLAAPPLITITMLAERIMRHFVAWHINPCESELSKVWAMR